MVKQALTYDSRDMRYHGIQSDGTVIVIDADAFLEAIEQRLIDNHNQTRDGEEWGRALSETADPDGWFDGMVGWITEEGRVG